MRILHSGLTGAGVVGCVDVVRSGVGACVVVVVLSVVLLAVVLFAVVVLAVVVVVVVVEVVVVDVVELCSTSETGSTIVGKVILSSASSSSSGTSWTGVSLAGTLATGSVALVGLGRLAGKRLRTSRLLTDAVSARLSSGTSASFGRSWRVTPISFVLASIAGSVCCGCAACCAAPWRLSMIRLPKPNDHSSGNGPKPSTSSPTRSHGCLSHCSWRAPASPDERESSVTNDI